MSKKDNKTREDAVQTIDFGFTEVNHKRCGCPLWIPCTDDIQCLGNAVTVFILPHECGLDDVVRIGAHTEEE